MKNHEQLPAIDENALDGVAGGASESVFDRANVMLDGVQAAKAAAKVPFSIAGAAVNLAGDIHEAFGEYLHSIGDALSGKKDA